MTSIPSGVDTDTQKAGLPDNDPTAAERKKDHIELAFQSQVAAAALDSRFYYEPIVAAHPDENAETGFSFLGKTMSLPLWVSSMTGGTEKAHRINHNLARACREFGMGMGLGSCRPLLYSDERLSDFAVRELIGSEQLLFANLGIAQLEQLVEEGELWRITTMLQKLEADGLIIHVNPLQEWLQPEGDRFRHAPLVTIKAIINSLPDLPVIVKEVGQGMGKESLRALLQLPLAAIDFAASGGTNFAKLELLRSDPLKHHVFEPLARVGHGASEMVDLVNELKQELGPKVKCEHIIISGGVQNFLDGYYLTEKIQFKSIYGQASAFLRYAQEDYEQLQTYVQAQARGLKVAKTFLRLK